MENIGPEYPSVGWQPTPPRRRWLVPAVVAVTAAAALGIGVALGAVLSEGGSGSAADTTGAVVTNESAADTVNSTPSAAEVHVQDVSLCTSYAIINSAMVTPDKVGSDLLPTVTALQVALADNPDASTPVRVAVTDLTSVYRARVAAHGNVRARGLAEPPPYSMDTENAAVEQVWTVCGLREK
mgnify:FL=1